MKQTSMFAAALTSLTLIFTWSPAQADRKHYAGAECVAQGTNQAKLNYNRGRMFNVMTSTTRVFCPMVRDLAKVDNGWVFMWNRNGSTTFVCQVREQSPTTHSYYFKSATQVGASSAPVKRTFAKINNHYAESLRYMYCEVPGDNGGGDSAITAYGVNEL